MEPITEAEAAIDDATQNGTDRRGSSRGGRTRKTRSDKGTKRATKSSGAKRTAPTNNLALERAEAAILNLVFTSVIASRYGRVTDSPNDQETEHLARLLKYLGSYPPFTYLQSMIRVILPFTGRAGKPGENPLNDLINYLKAWQRHNEMLMEEIYVKEPTIPDVPLMPKAAVAEKIRQRIYQPDYERMR